jgi:hypothetical protein
MKRLFRIAFIIPLICLSIGCIKQIKQAEQIQPSANEGELQLVGGPFENSEYFNVGIPQNINFADTS